MLLSPAVKTSYLNTMASASSPSPVTKRRHEGEDSALESSPLSGKRARPMIALRGSRSSAALGQPFGGFGQAQPHFAGVMPPSSDITFDDVSRQTQPRETFTHSSSHKGKAPDFSSSATPMTNSNTTFTHNNPHWLKVVTSYGYTFVKSDEMHLFEGNSDVQMVVEASPASSSEAPSSPPPQMRYPMGVEFPPTPSPSDDGNGAVGNRYFPSHAQGQAASKGLWEHVEGDRDAHQTGGINEMMMDEW
ncbi:hypothetical protein BCV70DRAFT_201194 [Testicularia cyperi]|uniref:Uncharacterized protein n=1 Tax=Testicularia cyperi TaxID=1882483 RepID=A0A317XKY7_9BASI|nr:hypothetical protein BCV70DRAFT_201194 [Testicularia cyperi]